MTGVANDKERQIEIYVQKYAAGKEMQKLSGGSTNCLYRVGDRVLKIGEFLDHEILFLQRCYEQGIPVPVLYEVQEITPQMKCLILEYLPRAISGRDAVLSDEEWSKIGEQAGKELSRIHQIGIDMSEEQTKHDLRRFFSIEPTTLIDVDAFHRCMQMLEEIPVTRPSLLHGDFAPHNMMIDIERRSIAAILDPSARIYAGLPGFDAVWAKLSRWSPAPFVSGFIRSYRPPQPEKKQEILLFEAVFCAYYAVVYAAMGDDRSSIRLQGRFNALIGELA